MWSDFVPGIFNCKIDYENSNNASWKFLVEKNAFADVI